MPIHEDAAAYAASVNIPYHGRCRAWRRGGLSRSPDVSRSVQNTARQRLLGMPSISAISNSACCLYGCVALCPGL